MNEKLKEQIKESLTTVLPITGIVLLLSIFLLPLDLGVLALFLTGACFLIVGMGFFQLGAEMSMTPLGQGVGGYAMKSKNISITIIICFIVGMIITIAEPDLQVLAEQVPAIPNNVLVWTVAVGVGIFLVIAVLRILLKISLLKILMILYPLLFIISFFAPADFTSVAFDSGGVTTGPMTVPFIMALGVGFSASRSDKGSDNDSFGLISLCSVGPIIMVLFLGIFYQPDAAVVSETDISTLSTMQDVMRQFVVQIPTYTKEVAIIIIPVFLVFVIFQAVTRTYKKLQCIRMLVGFLYTLIGTTLFLTGVNVGFAPVGSLLGRDLAESGFRYVLIPVGMIIGYYIVRAEPAVQILNRQVEEITNGTISQKAMNLCLSLGVACAVGLSMLRILTGMDIYWIIIPGYLTAFILANFVPQIFVGIAFDSGGVASGPMTSTFLLPMAIGACTGAGGTIMTDAFGVIALVALAPIIAILIMGTLYAHKVKQGFHDTEPENEDDLEIIDMDEI
ncbi:MAG: DUF1538 domain-containing protein [Clostridiaceae bacterium]|nr:DUF1538 domain-containing protein [Clostridiaceae bacterium]